MRQGKDLIKKTRQSDFATSAEVARWNYLYSGCRNEYGKYTRWAIFQSYAQKRTLRRLVLCGSLVESYEGKDVLDLACGGGHYGVMVAEQGGNWFGMDISPGMLRNAKRLLAQNSYAGYVVNGDISRIPFAQNSFDVIFGVGILSYFPTKTLAQILKQLPDLLKPGGYLIIQSIRLDVVTWLRSRLPSWVPRPIRLPGPLHPRRARVILRQLEGTPIQLRRVIEMKKLGIMPFQTIYLFVKE